jgi:hypothetical protein
MTKFNAKIEIKNGQIYITPDDNYFDLKHLFGIIEIKKLMIL